MTSPQQSGYDFEKVFKKSFKNCFEHGFIYKLIDTHSLEGAKKAAYGTMKGKWDKIIIPPVPSDFICINNGETMWVEAKNTINPTSFPMGNVKDHQLEFASKIEMAGGRYKFVIRHQIPRHSECFLLTLNDIIRLKKANQNRNSIKWEQLRTDPHVQRPALLKGSRFDVSMLFD